MDGLRGGWGGAVGFFLAFFWGSGRTTGEEDDIVDRSVYFGSACLEGLIRAVVFNVIDGACDDIDISETSVPRRRHSIERGSNVEGSGWWENDDALLFWKDEEIFLVNFSGSML